MDKKYKLILLTILTLSVLTIAIIEMTGISDHSMGWWRDKHDGEATLYDRHNNRYYHGEIYPDQMKTREQIVREMERTTVQFYETKHSFGQVQQGKVVKYGFRFKNTGEHPLMISKADVTCGCTVPNFPMETIAPDQEGEITVEFNTAGKSGYEEKSVVIHSNAIPEAATLKVEADIK